MTYIVSEDTTISGKWIQLISRIVDIKDQPVSQPANQSASHVTHVRDRQTNFSQSVCLSLTYQTD